MSNKLIFRLIGLIIIIVVLFLQLDKRSKELLVLNHRKNLIQETNSPYVKLLDQLPVYRDSIYKIYIAKIEQQSKIVFIKKGSISEIQKKSKFFLHIYPKDKKLLGANEFGNLAFDFNNNVRSFIFDSSIYYMSDTNLPAFEINKINIGQYDYNGNNDINWSTSEILIRESISRVLHFNKEILEEFE